MTYLNNGATTVDKPEGFKTSPPATYEEAAKGIAKLVGLPNPENVIFTESGKEALRIAILGLIKDGDHIISTDMEHDYVVDILDEAKSKGCQVTYIPLDDYGTVKYHLIEEAVTPQTKAIVCCHGSNVTGNVTDLDKVCTIARRNNLLVISDAAQTVGATPINMEELQLDVLCFTGHKKLMGPVGIGGVCLRKGLELDQSVLANLVAPSEEKLGQLCNSLDFIFEKGTYGMSMYPHRLAKRFFESVKSMDNVTVYGDFGTHTRVPTVAITIKGFTPEEIKDFMRENHIAIASGNCQSTRQMDSLGIDERGVARFSFGYFNTRIDVNDAIWALMKLQGLEDLYLLA